VNTVNLLKKIEQKEIARLQEGAVAIPEFTAGDTLKVNVRVKEGERERIQAYEGLCVARKNAGLNSSFTVRKISFGEGVERVFPLYSPRLESITVVRRGEVRRAKLYYLRTLRGKSARITERQADEAEMASDAAAQVSRIEKAAQAPKSEKPAKKAAGKK
jgi:large subunit ribosomal protein L19